MWVTVLVVVLGAAWAMNDTGHGGDGRSLAEVEGGAPSADATAAELVVTLAQELAALDAAVELARRMELLAAGLAALVPVAHLLELRGERARARRLAAFLHRHPRASFTTRRAAARLPGAKGATTHDGAPDAVLAMLDRALTEL